MSSFWDRFDSAHSSSTSAQDYQIGYRVEYNGPPRRSVYRRRVVELRQSKELRPLEHLVAAEEALKEESPKAPVGPEKEIIFNPEELVLGGETGWKKL